MLGWYFFIYTQSDRSEDQTAGNAPKLASWEAGIGGTDWLTDLVNAGRANSLGGNGYPNRFTLTAGVLQSTLRFGLPKHGGFPVIGDDYFLPAGWTGNDQIDFERLQSIDPNEIVLVDVWDQS